MVRKGEEGQALILVAAVLGLFLLGAVGLAIDAGQLYAHRQIAQNAADAAAQAGIMTLFNGTNFGAGRCGGAADGRSPCRYAALNRWFLRADDTADIIFPGAGTVPNATMVIRVDVSRTVPTTFMRILGPASGTVTASATAAMIDTDSPVPIVVLHPTLEQSFRRAGSSTIRITGGPSKSIQVNSINPFSVVCPGNGPIDLSEAGPQRNGGDFGNTGGPDLDRTGCNMVFGTRPGHYYSPSSPIRDPLRDIPYPPALPDAAPPGYTTIPQGAQGCPAGLPNPCRLYRPGRHAGGIDVGNRQFAMFQPGIYHLDGGGFQLTQQSIVRMAVAPNNFDPTGVTDWTGNVLFFNSGASAGPIQITANSGQINNVTYPTAECSFTQPNGTVIGGNCLTGSPAGSVYMGVLFFQDRRTTRLLEHEIWGGAGLRLLGSIYLHNTNPTDNLYQSFTFGGNAGSITELRGMIIVDVLDLRGGAGVSMFLDASQEYRIPQVALVR